MNQNHAAWLRAQVPRLLMLAALVSLGVLQAYALGCILMRHSPYQFDYRLVCDAGAALARGADPYLVANTPGGQGLSYPYTPLIAWLFVPLCHASAPGTLLAPSMFWAAATAAAWFLARGLGANRTTAALCAAAGPCVFLSGQSVMQNGNPAIVETPFMVLAILAWHGGRPERAAGLLGIIASIKILPLVWLAGLPLLLRPARAARAMAAGLAGFAAGMGVGVLSGLPWAGSFLRQLTGGIPGQHAAFAELGGGNTNPDLPDLAFQGAQLLGVHNPSMVATALALMFLGLGAALAWLRARQQGAMASTQLFCLMLLTISLALFRLKPYEFIVLSLPALACCLNARGALLPVRFAAVVLSLPCALSLFLVPALAPIAGFHQGISLALSVTILFGAMAVEVLFNPSAAAGTDITATPETASS